MINLLIYPDMLALDYGFELVSVQSLFTPSLLACSILDTRDYAKGDPSTPLDPWYITGLVDGEGNFSINATTRNGKPKIDFSFKVTQTGRNAGILYDLKSYFGVGNVVIDNREDNTLKYQVSGRAALLNVIVPHFDKFPLVTSKSLNFNDWKEAIITDATNSPEATTRVMQLKAGMNKGRSFVDKFNAVKFTVLEPMWVLGFVDGEGLFYSYVAVKTSRGSQYQAVDMSFEVGQNSHDYNLLLSLREFFAKLGTGAAGQVSPKLEVVNAETAQAIRAKSIFKTGNATSVVNFFNTHHLLTDKRADFISFREIWELKQQGAHKTPDGLARIMAIKANMNSARVKVLKQSPKQQ